MSVPIAMRLRSPSIDTQVSMHGKCSFCAWGQNAFCLSLHQNTNKIHLYLSTMKLKQWHGHVSLFAASLIWGINSLVSKNTICRLAEVNTHDFAVDPFTHSLMRWVGGMILFWIVSFFVPGEPIRRKDWWKLFVASLCAVVVNQLAMVLGLLNTSPINITLMASLTPIFTMIFAAIILHEPLTGKKVFGVSLGATGAVILVFAGQTIGGLHGSLGGDMMGFLAMIAFVLYLTLFSDIIERYSAITLMKWMFTLSTLVGIPLCVPFAAQVDYSALSADFWWQMSFVIVGATFLGYLLMPIGQKTLRPTLVSMYHYVQPGITAVLVFALGMEPFNIYKLLAMFLIFVGVYFVIKSKRRADMTPDNSASAQ